MKNYKTLEEFKDAIQKFNEKVENKYFPNSKETWYPILDGPMNIEEYYKSEIKILWVLKECIIEGNDTEFASIEYSKLIKEYWSYDSFLKSEYRTWGPIVNTSYGIINKISQIELPEIKESCMGEILHKISVININKYGTDSRQSNMETLKNQFEKSSKHGNWFCEQIEMLEPQIIVFGGTIELANKYYEIMTSNNDWCLKSEFKPEITGVYESDNRLFIYSWHPSKPFVDKKKYCNDIIETTKEWLRNK